MRETRGFGWRGVTFYSLEKVLLVFCVPCFENCPQSIGRAGETYVTGVDADGEAGPLLDFLDHVGGGVVDLS